MESKTDREPLLRSTEPTPRNPSSVVPQRRYSNQHLLHPCVFFPALQRARRTVLSFYHLFVPYFTVTKVPTPTCLPLPSPSRLRRVTSGAATIVLAPIHRVDSARPIESLDARSLSLSLYEAGACLENSSHADANRNNYDSRTMPITSSLSVTFAEFKTSVPLVQGPSKEFLKKFHVISER